MADRRQTEQAGEGRLGLALRDALPKLRRDALKPPSRLNLVEWADEYRYLSPEAASEPGKWKTDRVPVARGPMLAVSDPNVREVTVMCCTQLMKTELILNIIGYFVHQDPAPIMVMQPTLSLAEAFSKDRVDPMFRDTPVLQGKLGGKKSRDGANTIRHKQFPGGHLTMVGANAPGDLAMRPVRVVLCDEVDKYPISAGDEGDPIKLAAERAATFWNKLIVKVCSPTVEGKSRVAAEYEASDKRIFEVPCPHCGEYREMQWANVSWPEGSPDLAAYVCGECGCQWTEPDRQRAIKRGRWRATAPFKGHAGFKVSKLASPWEPLSAMAHKWEACNGDVQKLKTFYNTQLAETFREVGDAPQWQALVDKREQYATNTVAADVAFLTMGVDVQADRLELEVVGWCPGKRTYSVDYRVILGDTKDLGDKGPWAELQTVILTEQWEHESGALLPLRFTAIDSGFRTSIVYDFCRRFSPNRVAPVKGLESQALVISPPRKVDTKRNGGKVARGLKYYTVGTSVIKTEIYAWLKLNKGEDGSAPPGYCHFPEYEPQYFKELTSEQVMFKLVRGHVREMWVKSPGIRNEPLDCRVYARAAAALAGMDRFKTKDWDALARQLGAVPKKAEAEGNQGAEAPREPANKTSKPGVKRRQSSFWAR